MPGFPEFKPIEIDDRGTIQSALWEYQPDISELTFSNLYMWKDHYGVKWSQYDDYLLFLFDKSQSGLLPVGRSPRIEVTRLFMNYLGDQLYKKSVLERVDSRLFGELNGLNEFIFEPVREHFDYVYRSEDLIYLSGRKYHAKRNFINKFRSTYEFTYQKMTEEHIEGCLKMAELWCDLHSCDENVNVDIAGEFEAIKIALDNFVKLEFQGGVIEIDGKIEAFTLGEQLNNSTAVIHIEKANPNIRGLYSIINQQFCENNWASVSFINREQDLGEEPLRQAKLSYQPDHLTEKYVVRLKK